MISIIIPVLNEEKSIEDLLKQINRLEGDKEIIVVDGGSKDKTVEIASAYAEIVKSKKGRANQMNAGAKKAKGNILWFVHSDSKISSDSLKNIEDAISSGYIGGGFSLYFYDYDTVFMRYIAWTSNLRAKYLGLYFGDQAIFVRKDIFYYLQGYPDIEIMEDWVLSKKLHKTGKMKMVKSSIGTSARRFKIGGQFRTFLLMQKIKILFICGMSPNQLSKLYREAR
ncbi:glycosyltransferase [Crassaminicella thermophila]|uniref:4,4'-diaponeurosporenoate glycosyltransferase n=1 Tax=Crassaminicella thermophila TaxID=2599308 RepID=A0A5C0SHT2_CRATE|nr:TIGR04283 family arsenosugar biosynthesis glycosyltransferase [Crassaminicella thermophila]QEK12984.1 glycosyltransferase [Crassaminicella thermophila]